MLMMLWQIWIKYTEGGTRMFYHHVSLKSEASPQEVSQNQKDSENKSDVHCSTVTQSTGHSTWTFFLPEVASDWGSKQNTEHDTVDFPAQHRTGWSASALVGAWRNVWIRKKQARLFHIHKPRSPTCLLTFPNTYNYNWTQTTTWAFRTIITHKQQFDYTADRACVQRQPRLHHNLHAIG